LLRAALPLVFLVFWTGAAHAELVHSGPVADARIALQRSGEPVVAYVADGLLSLASRDAATATWSSRPLFVLPSQEVELDGLAVGASGRTSVLLRSTNGSWLALAAEVAPGRWAWRMIASDTPRDLIGPAGLALDASGRPLVAYALWRPSRKTFLRLVRFDARGRPQTQSVTRKGFPPSPTLAGAAPVVLPSGEVRVVETFAPAAIEWSPIPGDWLGQFVHSSALGIPIGTVATAVSGSTVYAAWTEAYPTLGPPAVVLAHHGSTAGSAVAIENAVLAGLALTPDGPELAANRCFDGFCLGLVGSSGLDGVVAGFAASRDGSRSVLLASEIGLDFFRSPIDLRVRIALTRNLSGRVDGVTGGRVTLYRERADAPRVAVGTFPVAADGSFVAVDPTAGPTAPTYRAVYVDPATSVPYAALLPAAA
jgi:hypothetical protein